MGACWLHRLCIYSRRHYTEEDPAPHLSHLCAQGGQRGQAGAVARRVKVRQQLPHLLARSRKYAHAFFFVSKKLYIGPVIFQEKVPRAPAHKQPAGKEEGGAAAERRNWGPPPQRRNTHSSRKSRRKERNRETRLGHKFEQLAEGGRLHQPRAQLVAVKRRQAAEPAVQRHVLRRNDL